MQNKNLFIGDLAYDRNLIRVKVNDVNKILLKSRATIEHRNKEITINIIYYFINRYKILIYYITSN
jgi:hypothetical protein